jgi:hypothetical protein
MPGLFADHALMDGHDINSRLPQCTKYGLQFGFPHREVAVDDSPFRNCRRKLPRC